MNGYKVSNKSNSNKFIFLPAAGYRNGGNLYYAGSYGYYWSASLDAGSSGRAYCLLFYSGYYGWYYNDRCDGQSVRAVLRQ